MNRGAVVALIALAVASVAFLLFGLSGGDGDAPGKAPATAAGAGGEEGDGPSAAGSREAPKVAKEGESAPDEEPEKTADLKLPGQLPSLGLQPLDPAAAPVKPHSEVELEGTIQQVDAELAIRAVFPKIRSCYAELRERAPQAQGRMLMKLKVRRNDDGQAGTGELFLKETQFTDPKYLTCIRTAIDETKFKTDASQLDGSFTFTLWLSPEDADNHRKFAGEQPKPAAP